MNTRRDMGQLVAWMTGGLAVPSFNVIVAGSRVDVPIEFHTFACLYPDSPRYRVYSADEDVSGANAAEMRHAIASCLLPNDAESRYRKYMVEEVESKYTPESGWTFAERISRRAGIPLGCYALGFTARGGQPRGVLWMNVYISPTMFLDRLQRASKD